MKKNATLVLMTLVVTLLLASPAALAQGNQKKVALGVVYVTPAGDDPLDIGGTVSAVEATDETGWFVSGEWRASKLFGLELDYMQAAHDVEFGGTPIGEVDLKPFSATLNFHLIHTKVVDFYLGPTVSYVSWSDIDLNPAGQMAVGVNKLSTDSETAYGASVGLDLSFAKSFAVVIGLRYLDLDVSPEGVGDLAVDPMIARGGIAFRW